jgi:sec-independent protein translocase protein TatC
MNQPEESFLTHLFELRDRLIRALLAVGILFICLFPWSKELYTLLAQPLLDTLPKGGQMIATDVVGVFLVPMKVTMMVAFLGALPYVLYQVWAFVAPGLYSHEKRLALPLVTASVVLFFCGMAFAYFLVFPTVFGFMAGIAPEGVAWMTDIDKYLSFVLSTFVAFGVTFEVPVIVIVLVKMGVVTIPKLKEWRPYVIVGAFVIGAVFTPPDVVSQIMLAVPLCLLYELGILLSRFVVVAPRAEQAPPASDPAPTAPAAQSVSPSVPPSDWNPMSDAEMDQAVSDQAQQRGDVTKPGER